MEKKLFAFLSSPLPLTLDEIAQRQMFDLSYPSRVEQVCVIESGGKDEIGKFWTLKIPASSEVTANVKVFKLNCL